MKTNKHIKSFGRFNENLDVSGFSESRLTDDDFLFRLFYFTMPDPDLVYIINDLLGEDTGDVRVDWKNSPNHIKQEIIDIIKSYILTLS